VLIGRDNRPSSPELSEALVRGLRAAGLDVVDLGTVPTPVAYWAEVTLGAQGAVQITGSHNPSEWNGIKMTIAGGAIYGRTIRDLRQRFLTGHLATGDGGLRTVDVLDDYVSDIAGRIQLPRPVHLAIDCGNGTASVVAVRLLEAIGARVTPLHCESDGTFPNHHPDPTVDENLADLIRAVRAGDAEAGIAFDGDGDRIGAVDEAGGVVRGDLLLLLFGLDLLDRKGPGQKLVFDVKCSQVLPEVFQAAGGVPIMWKTGHSLMKEKMKETGAALAGELSGHICVGGDLYLGFDDALFAACLLADLLARGGRSLSAMVSGFPPYVSTPEIRIEVDETRKFDLVQEALAYFRERYDVIDVDGVRILFGDGWGLLRTSNTQPVIVARYEARTPERLAEVRGVVEGWLRERGVDV
jgi:phosphomannomutase/phosphoglucomutase